MTDEKKKSLGSSPLKLVPHLDTEKSQDRRQAKQHSQIDRRRKKERREDHSGRGRFEQYFNLYNMMFDSPKTTVEIRDLMKIIMPDMEWQVRLAQEVSSDRFYERRKNKDDFRDFLRSQGALDLVVYSQNQAKAE